MNRYDDPEFFAAYAAMPRSLHGLPAAGEWPQLQKLLPPLAGIRMLDIGCGYGWHCRYAAQMGAAEVLGIDQSEKMIAAAQAQTRADNITYRVCSLQQYAYPAEAYDLALSNLVLHYIADLEDIYRRVWHTLKPGGVFVFNIEHPTFTAGINQQFLQRDGQIECWPVDNYYYPGERHTDFLGHDVVKQHHTLTQILMGLLHCGFTLQAVEEVLPPEQWRPQMPEEMRRPMMLLVKAEKEA